MPDPQEIRGLQEIKAQRVGQEVGVLLEQLVSRDLGVKRDLLVRLVQVDHQEQEETQVPLEALDLRDKLEHEELKDLLVEVALLDL